VNEKEGGKRELKLEMHVVVVVVSLSPLLIASPPSTLSTRVNRREFPVCER
jgi:hypothetical protein